MTCHKLKHQLPFIPITDSLRSLRGQINVKLSMTNASLFLTNCLFVLMLSRNSTKGEFTALLSRYLLAQMKNNEESRDLWGYLGSRRWLLISPFTRSISARSLAKRQENWVRLMRSISKKRSSERRLKWRPKCMEMFFRCSPDHMCSNIPVHTHEPAVACVRCIWRQMNNIFWKDQRSLTSVAPGMNTI